MVGKGPMGHVDRPGNDRSLGKRDVQGRGYQEEELNGGRRDSGEEENEEERRKKPAVEGERAIRMFAIGVRLLILGGQRSRLSHRLSATSFQPRWFE